MLNQAEAAKVLQKPKTGGVDTEKTESEIRWQEIENRTKRAGNRLQQAT